MKRRERTCSAVFLPLVAVPFLFFVLSGCKTSTPREKPVRNRTSAPPITRLDDDELSVPVTPSQTDDQKTEIAGAQNGSDGVQKAEAELERERVRQEELERERRAVRMKRALAARDLYERQEKAYEEALRDFEKKEYERKKKEAIIKNDAQRSFFFRKEIQERLGNEVTIHVPEGKALGLIFNSSRFNYQGSSSTRYFCPKGAAIAPIDRTVNDLTAILLHRRGNTVPVFYSALPGSVDQTETECEPVDIRAGGLVAHIINIYSDGNYFLRFEAESDVLRYLIWSPETVRVIFH